MNSSILISELSFKAVRSSGSGGQHVNKVSSKIELYFDVQHSQALTDEEKLRLVHKLTTRISKEGVLQLACSESRSQHKNKELVIKRFIDLIKVNLRVSKPRKKTKPSRSSIKKRLDSKTKQSLKKQNRKPPSL